MIAQTNALFDHDVERWVLEAIARPGVDFARLLDALPGVYPSHALRTLLRLGSRRRVEASLVDEILRESETPRMLSRPRRQLIALPIAHPLDYEWRFADPTVEALADVCLAHGRRGDAVALLGTPTILRAVAERGGAGRLILFEKNGATVSRLRRAVPDAQVEHCDLLTDPLPDLRAALVICDPPW